MVVHGLESVSGVIDTASQVAVLGEEVFRLILRQLHKLCGCAVPPRRGAFQPLLLSGGSGYQSRRVYASELINIPAHCYAVEGAH